MNVLMFFISLVITIGASPLNNRVIGGSAAKAGQFPHIVSLRYVYISIGDVHVCGGTILNKRWILTAAHCVIDNNKDQFYIKSGINNLNEDGIVYQVEDIIPHKDFNFDGLVADIALIRTQTDIKFIPNKIHPLPLNLKPMIGGEEVISGGWGSTELGGASSEVLQWLKATVVPEDECQKQHQPISVGKGMICISAGFGHGMCHGDSGSFLMCDGKLCGIVSWSKPCAIGYPDVFTRVSYYINWINEQINN